MDLDKLIETLKAGGATQAEIDQVVENYAKAKYQPETVAMQPMFFLESDKTVMLRNERVAVRLVNMDDLRRMLPKLVEFVRHLMAESGSQQTAEEFLDKQTPMGMLGVVMQKVTELSHNGQYPVWYVSLLEEIAILISNDTRTVTAQELISLPPSQFIALLSAIIEVNQQDFLALWASVPPGIRLMASTLASKFTNVMKRLNQTGLALGSSSGTAESTGKPSASSLSAKKPASRKPKSGAAA